MMVVLPDRKVHSTMPLPSMIIPFAMSSSTTGVPAGTSEQDKIGVHAQHLRKLYLREITVQACLYTGAFFLCYGPDAIINLLYISNYVLSSTF